MLRPPFVPRSARNYQGKRRNLTIDSTRTYLRTAPSVDSPKTCSMTALSTVRRQRQALSADSAIYGQRQELSVDSPKVLSVGCVRNRQPQVLPVDVKKGGLLPPYSFFVVSFFDWSGLYSFSSFLLSPSLAFARFSLIRRVDSFRHPSILAAWVIV